MSRFYGSLSGQAKTEATRRGGPNSGVQAHVRGWDAGVKVCAYVNQKGQDCFSIYLTGGSNDGNRLDYIGEVVNELTGPEFSIKQGD